MEDYVALEMLVKKTVADEIAQKGLAEIALRRSDAKFKSMVKCRILGDTVLSDGVPQQIASSAMQLGLSGTNSTEAIRGAIRTFEYGLGNQVNALTTTTKNMAIQVDGIYQLTSSVKSLSYLNAGISMANMAVDIAGFVIVNDKLNTLNSEVQLVANNINRIANVQKNEKISTCQKLIMRFNSMADKIRSEDLVNMDDLESLIIDMRAYISEMVLNFHDEALGTELVLKIIYALLPAYTSLLGEFTKNYYYEKHRLPANYELFLKLYDELENEDFRERLEDYFFIEEKMRSQDVIDILNAQTLLGLNGRVQIEDQTCLLQILETKDKVDSFDKDLDLFVRSWAKEQVPIIADDSGINEIECMKYFNVDN